MPVKLHHCSLTWFKISPHPCYAVRKALDDQGVPYEIVTHPPFPRGKRTELIEKTGQQMLPVIELADGTAIRAQSKELITRIKAGEFG